MNLADMVLMVICPSCNASGCRMCRGVGRVPKDIWDQRTSGEMREDFSDVTAEVSAVASGGPTTTPSLVGRATLSRAPWWRRLSCWWFGHPWCLVRERGVLVLACKTCGLRVDVT